MNTTTMTSADPAGEMDRVLAEGRALIVAGDYERAIDVLGPAMQDPAVSATAVAYFAAIAYHHNNYALAIDLLERIENAPGASNDVPEILAVLNALTGRLSEALYYGKLATTREMDSDVLELFGGAFPRFANVFSDIKTDPLAEQGRRRLRDGDHNAAIDWLSQHVRLFPRDARSMIDLADAHLARGEARTALDLLRAARQIDPAAPKPASRTGRALTAVGRYVEARACHEQAVAAAPDDMGMACDYLSDLARMPDGPGETVSRLGAKVAELAGPVRPRARYAAASSDGEDLRIGYLLAGLDDPEKAAFVASLVAEHDAQDIPVIGFGSGSLMAEKNARFRNRFDRWLNTDELDVDTLAAMMMNEGLDVLVDAAGVGAGELLKVMVQRPATVQVSLFGAPFGAPVAGYDYRLVDAMGGDLQSGGNGAKAWPMPLGVYAGAAAKTRPSLELPSETTGQVCFGADVDLTSLNPFVAMTWARVLATDPDSQLLLFDRNLSNPDNVQVLLDLFGTFGCAQRVDVVAAEDRRAFLAELDVLLAPFPWTTPFAALDALAAGVPVVAMDQPASAPGSALTSVLRRAGQDGMVAGGVDDYVARAAAWAADIPARKALRSDGWDSCMATPSFDIAKLARSFERAFSDMVRKATAGE